MTNIDVIHYKQRISELEADKSDYVAKTLKAEAELRALDYANSQLVIKVAELKAENERLRESLDMTLLGVIELLTKASKDNGFISDKMLIDITNKINAAAALKEADK